MQNGQLDDFSRNRFSGNTGSTFLDVFCVACVILLGTLINDFAVRMNYTSWLWFGRRKLLESWILVAVCFAIVAPSCLLNLAGALLIACHYYVVVSSSTCPSTETRKEKRNAVVREADEVTRIISQFAGSVMLLTWFCILFVDCDAFPRHLMKTEDFGISLMDVGVASSVFVLGLRSGLRIYSARQGFSRAMLVAFLGCGRYVLLRCTGYHQPVTEYGTHWNFLLSIAVILVLWECSKVILNGFRSGSVCIWLLASCVMTFHEIVMLRWLNLSDVVFAPGRKNILESNKEGLVSLLGYFSIFLFAVGTARFAQSASISGRLQQSMFELVVASWAVFAVIRILEHVPSASRRLCNLQYAMYCCASNVTMLWMFSHRRCRKNETLDAVARNQLVTFLMANVLTGALNTFFAMPSLSHGAAVTVVVGYMAVCIRFAVWMAR